MAVVKHVLVGLAIEPPRAFRTKVTRNDDRPAIIRAVAAGDGPPLGFETSATSSWEQQQERYGFRRDPQPAGTVLAIAHSEPPVSGKQSHRGSPMLSQATVCKP